MQLIDAVGDWIVYFFRHQPILGPMLLLIAEEAGIPMPIPGDVYISYTGYEIFRGHISYISAFIFLLLAVLLGSTILFFLAKYFGEKVILKFGKYIHINDKKLKFIEKKFLKYGPLVIIVGRHVPGFRIPVTVFAGISNVPYPIFIMSEFISVSIWIAIFMQIGESLGRKTLNLFHSHYSFLLFLIIPVILTIVTFLFGKFIPEEE
jgi:membrane protein DedA with SNARE-associated domain